MKHRHISETDIAAYFEKRLPPDKRLEIEEAIAESNLFDEFLALYHVAKAAAFSEGGHAPSGLVKKAIKLYPVQEDLFDAALEFIGRNIRILKASTEIDFSFPPAALSMRSQGNATSPLVVIKKSFDDGDATLYVENTGSGLCNLTVVLPQEAGRFGPGNLRAEVVHEGRVVASEHFTRGRCLFEHMEPGSYRVVLRKNRSVLGHFTIRIIEQGGEKR